LVNDSVTSVRVIGSRVLVACGTDGDSLDKSATSDKVEDLPDEGVGEQSIAGEGLALGGGRQATLLAGSAVVKVQQRHIGQLVISEIGQGIVSQDVLLLGQVVAGENVSGLGNVVLGGVYTNLSAHVLAQGGVCLQAVLPISSPSTTMVWAATWETRHERRPAATRRRFSCIVLAGLETPTRFVW
jgi:hypothetical protein